MASIVLAMAIPTVMAWHIVSGNEKSLLVSVMETVFTDAIDVKNTLEKATFQVSHFLF